MVNYAEMTHEELSTHLQNIQEELENREVKKKEQLRGKISELLNEWTHAGCDIIVEDYNDEEFEVIGFSFRRETLYLSISTD